MTNSYFRGLDDNQTVYQNQLLVYLYACFCVIGSAPSTELQRRLATRMVLTFESVLRASFRSFVRHMLWSAFNARRTLKAGRNRTICGVVSKDTKESRRSTMLPRPTTTVSKACTKASFAQSIKRISGNRYGMLLRLVQEDHEIEINVNRSEKLAGIRDAR